MINLLNAGFTRLRKNRAFWVLVILSFMLSVFEISVGLIMKTNYNATVLVSELLFDVSSFIGIAVAIFISFFIGVEYSDGAMRNKIIIGHSRKNIYFTNFIISIVAINLISMAYFLPTLIIGIPLFGKISISIGLLMVKLAVIEMIFIAYSAIFTLIAMLISSRTSISVITLVLAFSLVFAATLCLQRLNAPQYVQTAEITDSETQEVDVKEVPNPRYLSGTKRKVYEFLYNINPAGCNLQQEMASGEKDIAYLPVYLSAVSIVFVAGGILLFERKELK